MPRFKDPMDAPRILVLTAVLSALHRADGDGKRFHSTPATAYRDAVLDAMNHPERYSPRLAEALASRGMYAGAGTVTDLSARRAHTG